MMRVLDIGVVGQRRLDEPGIPALWRTFEKNVVSEFPFPETEEGCRSVPGRLMCGVQFFEAHIGCQLLPSSRFATLLKEAGFVDVGIIDVTGTHVVIHGTKA